MKLELVDILACPMCHGTLTIEVKEQRGEHALYGFFACPGCMRRFEIRNIGLPPVMTRSALTMISTAASARASISKL